MTIQNRQAICQIGVETDCTAKERGTFFFFFFSSLLCRHGINADYRDSVVPSFTFFPCKCKLVSSRDDLTKGTTPLLALKARQHQRRWSF